MSSCFLCRSVLALRDDLVHPVYRHAFGPLNIVLRHRNKPPVAVKYTGIEFHWMVYLVICDPVGHHHVCHRMSTREHVLDLLAGLYVPVRNIVLPHQIFAVPPSAPLPFTHLLHDCERSPCSGMPFSTQIVHDVVSGRDGVLHSSSSVVVISSCALFSHTSVPWENPEIRTRSAKACPVSYRPASGGRSLVPNSGIP